MLYLLQRKKNVYKFIRKTGEIYICQWKKVVCRKTNFFHILIIFHAHLFAKKVQLLTPLFV